MNNEALKTESVKFALDIGTRSVIGTVGILEGDKFRVIGEKYLEHQERAMVDGQIHDIDLVAESVQKIKKDLEEELDLKLECVSIAAAGRFLKTLNSKGSIRLEEEEITREVVRSLELTAVANAEEKVNNDSEGRLYCVGYSVVNYYLGGYVISNLLGHKGDILEAEVIATFLPRSVIDSLYAVMGKVGLTVTSLTLEPIAAIEAAVPKKLRLLNIALVDIGAGTSDIAISSDETIIAYGMVPLAGDEVTEAIVQNCLVDFYTAEKIKKELEHKDKITYIDVIGIENEISSEVLKKAIKPIVKKIAEGISLKIMELNGNKIPSAIFLVGGGAYTPWLKEEIAISTGVPIQRIAIKDRAAVDTCISENCYGSAGVTVLGIALISLRNTGNDFIDVHLNNTPISLFRSHQHNVMDVLLQAGINPNMLIGKKGKNIRFMLNGKKRIEFGGIGKNAEITVNGQLASLESKVREGCRIYVNYAENGEDANPTIMDEIREINSITIYIDNEMISLEPMAKVNSQYVDLDYRIQEDDNVQIIFPRTIGEIKKYIFRSNQSIYKDNILLDDTFELYEGCQLSTVTFEDQDIKVYTVGEAVIDEEIKEKVDLTKEITIIVNGKDVILSGKEEYIFVQAFNYVDVDLSDIKGNLVLKLNGKGATYTQKLQDGDNVEVYWQ